MLLICPPVALGFSIAGLLRDERKLLAIVTLLVSGAFILYFLLASGILPC